MKKWAVIVLYLLLIPLYILFFFNWQKTKKDIKDFIPQVPIGVDQTKSDDVLSTSAETTMIITATPAPTSAPIPTPTLGAYAGGRWTMFCFAKGNERVESSPNPVYRAVYLSNDKCPEGSIAVKVWIE